jgi:hypothetical protein
MHPLRDNTANLATHDNAVGLDLLVTDARGRPRHVVVASEWPAAASTPTQAPAQIAGDPAEQDIHHIAIHMGSVMPRPAAPTPTPMAEEAADVQGDLADCAADCAADEGAAANAADSHPVAGDGNTAPDSSTPT